MKSRIAIWAVAGGLVVRLWSMYSSVLHGQLQGLMAVLLDITCPVAIARQHPLSVYTALFANVLTYALIGLAIEFARRPMRRSLEA